MLLSDLPPEIIYSIATYLPTANAFVCLALTCRRLHEIIASGDWSIFRAFVKSQFYNIPTPPFWKDAARALTSRSRALDRHAVIGRFVTRPSNAEHLGGSSQATRGDNPTHGYRPAIDSYEVWNGSNWHDRREVLAWSDGHELVLQIRQRGSQSAQKSFVFNDLEHISSHDDICGLHLLRPEHHAKTQDREHVMLGRMRGELVHLTIAPESNAYELKQKFQTFGLEIERTDMSDGPESILAAHLSNGTIALYSTTTEEEEVSSFGRLHVHAGSSARYKSSKFLSPNRLAVTTGRPQDAIAISRISQERIALEITIPADFVGTPAMNGLTKRSTVTAIAPLTGQTGASSGNTFLAAWGGSAVRLHDLRSHKQYEQLYIDMADHNPLYCIHPFGHDRFVVGAGGDAVVKIFDLRMPTAYDYRTTRRQSFSGPSRAQSTSLKHPSRDLSIFLSSVPPSARNARSTQRHYRGPIYTMSSPSLLSPTIYTGIAGGIVRLDFASTDDLTGSNSTWYREAIDLPSEDTNGNNTNEVIELSGYERPDSRDITACSKLRSQVPFSAVNDQNLANEQAAGWDRRWNPLEAPGAWRRRD
ncbi:uncharacterized protein DSM5745_08099 [Aspergillus mulundensis]|uniref:F-box domain-containing protein n=1 Tax=Aspergillus mulundensis TaxID=1810919 RepID=A0A3D8R9K8_9EURO|nr:hypothetical protein DSM5745_08099 [Aspergillus mulundensis]RDW70588.1 hypothetical protein DSM5745_08099 [Aspergillus mulundensis]